jgi:phosphoribosylglycinamide formyltransferase 1
MSSIIVITGTDPRHQYFIDQLAECFQLSAIFCESPHYPTPEFINDKDREIWDWFFKRREEYELKTFESHKNKSQKNTPPITTLQRGEIHSEKFIDRLKQLKPDFIAIFGTSIFKPPYLENFSSITFNLHLGLPQYYRGSSCNFWPIHDLQLKHLGATVHQINSGIDTGMIAVQKHTALEKGDDEQTLAGKTILIGVQLMIKTIHRWQNGTLELTPSNMAGPLYKIKDFDTKSIARVKEFVQTGQLKNQINLLDSNERSI